MPASSRSKPSRRKSTSAGSDRSFWSFLAPDDRYWKTARRPLQILAFLLPLIVLYEISLALVLRHGSQVLSVQAHKTLLHFFHAFGIPAAGGLYLGGLVILLVLLLWHILSKEKWQIDVRALGQMALESAALTIPLLIIAQLVARSGLTGALPAAAGDGQLAGLNVLEKMAISVGAGLYEELMFRMLLIAFLHTLLVDVAKMSAKAGAALAIVVSAAMFTWYHPLADAAGNLIMARVVFYFLAGLYFGAIFTFRGFGIVVAVHALYDIVTALFLLEAS